VASDQEYATDKNELPYVPDLHISNTIRRKRGTEFWLYHPCPKGIDPDDWEAQRQAKWGRIFNKGN